MAEVLAYAIGLAIAVGSRLSKRTAPRHTYRQGNSLIWPSAVSLSTADYGP